MLIYLFKTVLIQAIGLAVYFIFLRNEKLFAHSRTFLWSVITCSFLIPLIQIPLFNTPEIIIHNATKYITLPEIQVGITSQVSFPYWQIISIVVICIAIIQCIRLFISYRKIIELKNKAISKENNIYFSDKIELPFSFLGSIYIPIAYKNIPALPIILAHEQVHIEKMHSLDKIAISIISRLLWFNPFFILFHKELELIHEFQVDDKVAQDYTLDSYLESFLQSAKLIQSNPLILTHSFFSSPIKNRIIMLYKKSKNEIRKKTLSVVILSLALISIVFIQCQQQEKSQVKADINEIDKIKPDENGIYEFVEDMPEFMGGDSALQVYLSQNIHYPKEAKEKNIQGRIIIEFVIDENGEVFQAEVKNSVDNGAPLDKEALRVIRNMPKWNAGVHNEKTVKVRYVLPIMFQLNS